MNTINIENRKARHDYFIEKTYECGIALLGNEVKSIRAGMITLKDSWANITNGEMFLYGVNITPWETSNRFDVKQGRTIKLLLHKSEIRNLDNEVRVKGYTLIPVKVYNTNNKLKVQLGLCKGKHNYDKREALKKNDIIREVEREMHRL